MTQEKRLARLEGRHPNLVVLHAFAEVGETLDQAIARQYPNGVAETAMLIVLRFDDGPSHSAESGSTTR
jgi:hypothetical protein